MARRWQLQFLRQRSVHGLSVTSIAFSRDQSQLHQVVSAERWRLRTPARDPHFFGLPKASWLTRTIWASTSVLKKRGYGGVGLCGRKGVEQLPLFKRVCGVPALSAWCGPPLPHVGGVQYSSEATATGPTSHQDLQAVGSNVAKHSGLGPGDGLIASTGCGWTFGSNPFAGFSFVWSSGMAWRQGSVLLFGTNRFWRRIIRSSSMFQIKHWWTGYWF